MKKIAWTVVIAFCAVNISSCAVSEKPKVGEFPTTPSSSQTSPIYIQGGSPPPEGKDLDIGKQPQGIGEESQELTLPTTGYINDRIYEYGRKLDRWKELDNQSVNSRPKDEEMAQMVGCLRSLQNVLNGYSELRSRILEAQQVDIATKISNEEIFELQKNDITFLEGACNRLLAYPEDKGVDLKQGAEEADLNQLESLIDSHAVSKKYQEVIQDWLKIPESQRDQVHLRTKLLYGNALMYHHQEEKAAQVYQQAVNQLSVSEEQATDLVSLRKVLADLYTASGNYQSAANEYKKISEDYLNMGQLEEWSKLQLSILARSMNGSPELSEYSEMLRNFLGFVPERDGYKISWQAEKFQTSYPYSAVTANVDLIKQTVDLAADKWFNGSLAQVDSLVKERKFPEALELLDTIPTDIIGADKQQVIKAKHQELLLGEAVESQTGKTAEVQEQHNQWNNGLMLAKDGRYEEAIAVLNTLKNGEDATKAEAKIKELSLEAAKADRKKAADLFIRFTKTSDVESKKKLLVESRRLLKNILTKYPDVEIASKVRGNIERVEQEMRAIDPNLVITADQETTPATGDDGADPVFTGAGPRTMSTGQAPIIDNSVEPPIKQ